MKLLEVLSRHMNVDQDLRGFLLNETQMCTLPKHTILSQQGETGRTVYFMESGMARNYYYENGKDITANFYLENQVFGNVDTIFTGQPTRYNLELLEESTLACCNYQKLEEFCETSLPAANFSRYLLGNLMTQILERLASLQYMTAREKYLHLMDKNPAVILRAPLGMVASYLGISQETLSRIRGEI